MRHPRHRRWYARSRSFNPRTPHGVRLNGHAYQIVEMLVSIHAPHTGCDTPAAAAACARRSFNPRTPHGVRHHLLCKSLCKNQRFNPRTPHGVRRGADHIAVGVVAVSIHAPHTGCDILQSLHSLARHVSIHAPHTGCDLTASTAETYCVEFQSTHPTRGAT